MFFQPTIGVGGLAGWRILERTTELQRETFDKSPVLQRNIVNFEENIGKITSAEDLVKDRQLMTVVLGAFGLGEEIDKRALIQKMLEGGTDDPTSLANRFNDTRYQKMVQALGFGDITAGSNLQLDTFKENIVARYKEVEFEGAVGESDNDMRLAMNFKRQIGEIAESGVAEATGWFQIMGQLPLREVVGTAFNIPSEVSQLDVDVQQELFAKRSKQFLGDSSPEIFKDPEVVDKIIRRFFTTRQIENGPSATTPGYSALSLLQNGGLSGASNINLILSQA